MQHVTNFDPATDSANNGNALALPSNLDDLCAGRDRAIALWLNTYDTLHANCAAAGAASIGGNIGLHAPQDRYSDTAVTIALLASGETNERDRETGILRKRPAREKFESVITAEVDRRCWSHLMKQLGFDQLLDRQAREEFEQSLKSEPPAFTVENCKATFGTIWGSRRDMYLRGIANVFMAMDRRFRSHDAFAIGNRLIIERAFSDWGSWDNYNRRDTLRDVERIFLELDGEGPLGYDDARAIHNQIYRERESARKQGTFPAMIEGPYFRVRAFQNGNLHLWFTRKDLLAQVNALLLEYYKPVEGDAGEGPSYESGPAPHRTPAKNFGEFFTSSEIAEKVAEMCCIRTGDLVLEPSAGGGALARAAQQRGAQVTCVEIQPGLAHELGMVHGFRDTYNRDFLDCDPANWPQFDRIVMNPPFDRGRDCDHVLHAYKFLKPGGTLVAIMSARAEFCTDARHKPLHELLASTQRGSWHSRNWFDLPERSFAHAGTNVNTVMLRIEKPR